MTVCWCAKHRPEVVSLGVVAPRLARARDGLLELERDDSVGRRALMGWVPVEARVVCPDTGAVIVERPS